MNELSCEEVVNIIEDRIPYGDVPLMEMYFSELENRRYPKMVESEIGDVFDYEYWKEDALKTAEQYRNRNN
ncbi:MAG: hypothetical protein KAT37_03905 [Candidatus Aenigmarchaeota archaeon]|nr:hypothetical protein [Candidatus Aenigmarchaeota archaeon]